MSGDGRVRTVIDNTACLVPEAARKFDIAVAPIGRDISEDTITTSAVSPLKLRAVYTHALERSDKDSSDAGIATLHFGKRMSVTWPSVVTAAEALDHMTIIDAGTVGAGVGATAVATAKVMRVGASRDEVVGVTRDVLQCCQLWLFVPKLDSLHRGGCISASQAVFSTAPAIKPIIGTEDGLLALVAKCRTEVRVKQHMVDFITKIVWSASSASHPSTVLLHHSDALDDVHEFQAMLVEELPDDTWLRILGLPGSLITHIGQGAYAADITSSSSIDSDAMDFEVKMGMITLFHDVEKSNVCAVDAKTVDMVDDDSGDIDSSGDSAGTDGSVGNAGATDSGEPIIDQAEVEVVENPAASRNRSEQIHHTVITSEQGISLFTTAVSKLPTWSEGHQVALDKAKRLVKAISDSALRDKSDPEGAVFGTEGERSQESSSNDRCDGDGDKKER